MVASPSLVLVDDAPRFGRVSTSAGTIVEIASRNRCLPRSLRNLSEAGSDAANSTSGWSSSGTRASSDTAIVMRSTLVRMSPGR